MKTPKSLKIGPYTYKTTYRKHLQSEGKELWGHILHEKQQVRIQGGLSEEREFVVLIHECIHGIDDYMEIGLTEEQIQRLGTGIAHFLIENGYVKRDG